MKIERNAKGEVREDEKLIAKIPQILTTNGNGMVESQILWKKVHQ